MRLIVISLLLFLNHIGFAQVCDTIVDGKAMNCIGSNGLKQGTWVSYSNKLRHCDDDEGINCLAAIGNYKDGEKIGSWKYFDGPKYNSWITKEVIYGTNDTLEVIDHGLYGHKIEKTIYVDGLVIFKKLEHLNTNYKFYSRDNIPIIEGEYITNRHQFDEREKVILFCKDDSCSFTLNDKGIILKFQSEGLNNFEYELSRLELGIYNRKIKELILKSD